jgi:hypothetical protein
VPCAPPACFSAPDRLGQVRVRTAALLLVALAAVGCSGSSDSGESSQGETFDQLAAGEQIAVTPGTSDLAPGPIRYTFLILDEHGRPIEKPSARIWIARTRDAVPFVQTTARFVPVDVPEKDQPHMSGGVFHDDLEVGNGVYVVNTRLDKPGIYWLLARPAGVKDLQALGNIVVRIRTSTPAVGATAPPSKTPTLGEAPLRLLTTRVPPDRALLRYSIADSLRRHVPFVVTFATPAFCSSRLCGPVVDIVDRVRRDFAGRGVRFIHVEIYARNNPSNGVNRFVKQWGLPSEPWTFLVGRDGRIKAKFEGVVSVGELRAAVRRTLR